MTIKEMMEYEASLMPEMLKAGSSFIIDGNLEHELLVSIY